MENNALRALARAQYDWTVAVRRKLHRVPEKGFQEEKTRAIIRGALHEIGIDDTEKDGYITALIQGGQSGCVTGLRADFDALPIEEPEGCPFRSEHPGWMHACGHDMHTAILLGTARLLFGIRDRLPGAVKLLFQPAEETTGGARPMVEAGVLTNPRVDRVYGLHVMPYLPVGAIETRAGTLNASTDNLSIDVIGESAHGAYPNLGRDAIVAAAHILTAMQTLISRNVSPLKSAVVSFGVIQGGTAANILCDRVHMVGTLRAADPEIRQMMRRRIREVAENTARALGVTTDVRINDGYSPLVNHPEHAARILRVGEKLLGAKNVNVKEAPSMGAEDFAYFIEHTPGAFYHLGCAQDDMHPCASLHSKDFFPDERCMETGILMQSALALTTEEDSQ